MLKQLDILIGFVTVMTVVSLLITVVTQMISSYLQLRGRKLCDALEAVFKTIAPDLDTKARAVAEAVLRHPLISDSDKSGDKRALASTIRPEEIVTILRNLVSTNGEADKWIGNQSVASATGSKVKAVDIAAAAKNLLDKVTGTPGAAAASAKAIDGAVAALGEIAPAMKAQLNEAKASVLNEVQKVEARATAAFMDAEKGIETYFNMVEDRAREWFATHTQIVNSVLAVLFAFGLQLDTIDLYRRLSTDDTLRAQLVAAVADVQKQTETILGKAKSDDLKNASSDLEYLNGKFKSTREALENTGFTLVPKSYGWEFFGSAGHWLGTLLTALLLSLGAPYWFNTLKALTNFRPTLAKTVDEDSKKKKQK